MVLTVSVASPPPFGISALQPGLKSRLPLQLPHLSDQRQSLSKNGRDSLVATPAVFLASIAYFLYIDETDASPALQPSLFELLQPPLESGQYASAGYGSLLDKHRIIASMSRIANPWDNAKCESFMKTLKQEEIQANEYR